MANISNELNNIKNATFGKEVRGSIHDGIDKMNKEVESTTSKQNHLEKTFDQLIINSGSSNSEIVDARVDKNSGISYQKLGDRLDKQSEQLDNIENNQNNLIYNIKDFGAKCDGVNDDSEIFRSALNSIPIGSTLGIFGICLINKQILIENINNKKINVYGELKVNDKINFKNCNNFEINSLGKIIGTGLQYAIIQNIDSANNKVIVDNGSIFNVIDTNVTVPKNFGVNESKYFGVVTGVSGNVVSLEDNTILPNFSAITIGDKLYSSNTSSISFELCDNLILKGYIEPTLYTLKCNNIDVDVKMKYGNLSFDFSYNITVKADLEFSRFYGLFAKGCRKLNLIKVSSKHAFFTGICLKSCWEVNQGDIHIEEPCLMAMQIIKNTIENPAIPGDNNSNCQNELTCRNINIDNLTMVGVRQGLRINYEVYGVNINNLTSINSIGNQLLIQDNARTIKNINVNNINVYNHEQTDGTKYKNSCPIYLQCVDNCNITNITIDGTKPKNPIRLESVKNLVIENITLSNFQGTMDFGSCENVTIGKINTMNALTTVYLLTIANMKNLEINNVNIIDDNITRGILATGTLSNIIIDKFKMEHSVRVSGTRGIYLTPSNGEGITINKCILTNITDNILLSNLLKCNVNNNIIKGGYNSIVTNGTTDIICITGNTIESKTNVNSSATNKYVDGNLFIAI